MSKKTRAMAFGVFVGVFLLSYTIGNFYKMSDTESEQFLNDFQAATGDIDALGLFVHNTSVALPMFVPAFGVGWGSYTGWQTGAAFMALISSNPDLYGIPPLTILLASPFGLLELGAYAIAMSRSFLLIWRIAKKNPIKKEIIPSAIEVGIVIAILLIAGFVEYSMINQQVSLSA